MCVFKCVCVSFQVSRFLSLIVVMKEITLQMNSDKSIYIGLKFYTHQLLTYLQNIQPYAKLNSTFTSAFGMKILFLNI